jgi:hypothetical protein
MIPKSQQKALLIILLCLLFTSQSCMGISSSTPVRLPPTTTASFSATNTPTPTAFITSTPDDVATQHAIETASIQTLVSTVEPITLATFPSPDGKWRVEVIRYDCINYTYQDYKAIIAYEQLKLVNLNDGTEKIVDDQPQACDGIGMAGLGGLYWSPNNRYFYYTDAREGYPETCGNYAVPPIYRLDTLKQESIMLGGAHLSPDRTKLAMWEWQEHEIVIWDLDQGEIGRVPGLVSNTLDGQISWSSDSQSLVYLQTTFDCAQDYGKTYVTRLDLPDLSQSLLLEYDSPGFGWLNWDAPNRIRLRDGIGKNWTYNLVTKEFKAAP